MLSGSLQNYSNWKAREKDAFQRLGEWLGLIFFFSKHWQEMGELKKEQEQQKTT